MEFMEIKEFTGHRIESDDGTVYKRYCADCWMVEMGVSDEHLSYNYEELEAEFQRTKGWLL